MSASASPASAVSGGGLAAGTEGQYCFLVEWFDQQAAMMRQYHLLYYLLDDTIEVRPHSRNSKHTCRCMHMPVDAGRTGGQKAEQDGRAAAQLLDAFYGANRSDVVRCALVACYRCSI